mgnify:CR=1 FL=1
MSHPFTAMMTETIKRPSGYAGGFPMRVLFRRAASYPLFVHNLRFAPLSELEMLCFSAAKGKVVDFYEFMAESIDKVV